MTNDESKPVKTAATLEPCALTIAGSDSGAGAGIQADLKTFSAHGVYGASVLTMVTSQNTLAVRDVHLLPPQVVLSQLEAVFEDFNIPALKTGALGSSGIIRAVAGFLGTQRSARIVIDPVMISKHGSALLAADAVGTLISELIPLAAVLTPNLSEAAALAGMPAVDGREMMLEAAQRIMELGCGAVVIKGGHIAGDPVDLLLQGDAPCWIEGGRVDTPHTHGTGCTFSAAITANLVLGMPVADAVKAAKSYIIGALRHAHKIGQGINPVNHFWERDKEFGAHQNGSGKIGSL